MVNVVLKDISPSFGPIHAQEGRPSSPPKRLHRALLPQLSHSIRSERLLMEALDYNPLYRRFVPLSADHPVWSPTTLRNNKERLINHAIADKFFERGLILAREAGLLSDQQVTVDGTLTEAWDGQRSLKPNGTSGDAPDDPETPTVAFCG